MSQAQTTGRILLKNVRIAFANGIFNASTMAMAGADAKPKFNCGIIIAADHPQLAEIKAKMVAVAKEKWASKAPEVYKALEKADKLALHDGDLKPNYDGYPGNFFLSPSSPQRPLVIDIDKTPLSASEGRIYGGCYVNVSIDLWAQDNQYGKRINAQLRGVQFVADGAAFGSGGAASEDEFETVGTVDEFA